LLNAPPGEEFPAGQYQIYGLSYRYHVKVKEPRCDRLMVFKVWRSPHSMLEQNRDRSWIPPYEFRFGQPLNVLEAQEVIRELQLAVDEDQANRREREADEHERRLYLTWRGVLQAKGDLEKAKQSPLRYNGVRVERGRALFQMLDLPGEDLVGQPRSIRLPNGHFLAGEVDDVRDRTLALYVTFGDPNLAPRSGELLFDTRAAEAALDRQKAALDAVRFDRATRPDLGPLLLHPEKARIPKLGEEVCFFQSQLDEDKKEAVRAALATEHFLVVEGPPGTGKTTFIAEVVHQTLQRNPEARILLSSQTHVALDNALERILDLNQHGKLLRVGRLGDEGVSPRVEALRLEDQMEMWRDQVFARGREFLGEFARTRKVSQKAVEIAALLEQATTELDGVKQLQVRIECRKREIEELTVESPANAPGSRGRAISNDRNSENLRLLKKDLSQFEKDLKDAQKAFEKTEERLQELAGEELDGMEPGDLAAMTAKDLADLANAFIDPGDPNTAMYKLLRRIYQEWILRFARTEDFHAALLKRANVIAGTCIGIAGVKGMQDLRFDLCIVDEASKATATEVLVPLSRSRRWILVGDQRQLPPFKDEVVRRPDILQRYDLDSSDLEQTLFDHLLRTLPEGCRRSLLTQHRMVPAIGDLISNCFYEGKLKSAGPQPDPHLAAVLPVPVVWFSTAQLPDHEEFSEGAIIKNRCEALVIRKLLSNLNRVFAGAGRKYKVAVLTGYSAQRMELKRLFAPELQGWSALEVDCNTVDAFQGREADVAVYSVTRSNRFGKLGFLSEEERLNVALSRGRYGLAIVGDHGFCAVANGRNPFRSVLDHVERYREQCALKELRP
jgi:hypothetical protein